jgi:hypothetical protein
MNLLSYFSFGFLDFKMMQIMMTIIIVITVGIIMAMIVRVVILCFPTKTKNMLLQDVYLLYLNLTKAGLAKKQNYIYGINL